MAHIKTERSSKFAEDFCPNCCLPIFKSTPDYVHNCVDALRNTVESMKIRIAALESELRNEVVTYYRRERSMMLQIAELHEQMEHKQINSAIFLDEINGQDVSKLDESRAGQIFMQAEEPINVKVKRRPNKEAPTDSTARSPTPPLTSGKSRSNSSEKLLLEQSSDHDVLEKERAETKVSPKQRLCTECNKRKAVGRKSVSVQTDDQMESIITCTPESEIWLRDSLISCSDKTQDLSRYGDLMSHEDIMNGAEDFDEEEAIYEDLYNHIMPLPSPFNLVEYEDVIISRTSEKLGMTLCHGNDDIFGVFISSLEPNGVAARTGCLQIGDQILQINESLIETKEQALTLFKAVKNSNIKVTVARSKQQMYEEILFTDDPSSPLSSLFPIMEKPVDAKSASSNNASPKLPTNALHKPSTPVPKPPEVPERMSPTKGLSQKQSTSQANEQNPFAKDSSPTKQAESSSWNNLADDIKKPNPDMRTSSPIKKLGAGKLQPQSRNIDFGDVPFNNPKSSQPKPNFVSNERFDSSGYCSSNLNSPKMLHKLSHSPSIASSIAAHGKQYRSYLKLMKLKDEDSVYGVPLGLMPDLKDEQTKSPKNRDSMVSPQNRHRRTVSQIRHRAQKIKEETLFLTTDDETVSELKTGKFWTKQERKRQFLVAREHKQRRYMMERSRALYREMQNSRKTTGSGSSGNEAAGCEKTFSTLSKRELKEKKEKILDNFWTIQELLAHGGRMQDGSLHPLLSVTTV